MFTVQDTRDHILDAAAAVVIREGSTNLTLDKVAREAGISKGGLLYHFSAKERLIEALVRRMIEHFDRDLTAFESSEPGIEAGRRTRAFVRATLEGRWDRQVGLKPHGVEMFAALLAALSTDPTLLSPLRKRSAEWQAELEADGLDPVRATVVRLAADGLWFSELLGLARFAGRQRKDIVAEILELARARGVEEPDAANRKPARARRKKVYT